MKKHMTSYGSRIIEVEVERETESSVWVKGRRHNKRSEYENYWDSWEDAHSFLLQNAERWVEGARLRLERAKGEYGQIKGMKKPAAGE